MNNHSTTECCRRGKMRHQNFSNQSQRFETHSCFHCARPGHRERDCRKKQRDVAGQRNQKTSQTFSSSRFCTFCQKPEHTREVCRARNRSETTLRSVNHTRPTQFNQARSVDNRPF